MLAAGAWLAQSCSESDEPAGGEGVEVGFRLKGMYGAPLSDYGGNAQKIGGVQTRSVTTVDDATTIPIPDGTTLWLSAQMTKDADGNPVTGEEPILKSYRVSGSTLYPCTVDAEGEVIDSYASPLFLPYGTYRFVALGPARELIDGKSLYIDNGEYVIANDERYAQTQSQEIEVMPSDVDQVKIINLNPLINQTARLKFTLYRDESDVNVHSLSWQSQSVEISGLQNKYSRGTSGGSPWNWTHGSLQDTLVAFPAEKNTRLILSNLPSDSNSELVATTEVLPTDAYATPLIIFFNVNVNGVPSMFEMMLNRKVFRAGYSYNYRGKISITGGVTILEWQNISWDQTIPIL